MPVRMAAEYLFLKNLKLDMKELLKKLIRQSISDVGTQNESSRDKWVIAALSRLPADSRLLDAGAGQQRYRPYCSHLHYVSQDFCQYASSGDGDSNIIVINDVPKIDIISDIISIPAENGSFDAILCTEVLEHLPDPIAALQELYRLLRVKGELILTAPFCSITHMAPNHYYSGFNKYFYKRYLPSIGFTIIEINASGDYSEYAGQELRRLLTLYENIPFYIKACIAILLRFIGANRNLIKPNNDMLCYGYHVLALKK